MEPYAEPNDQRIKDFGQLVVGGVGYPLVLSRVGVDVVVAVELLGALFRHGEVKGVEHIGHEIDPAGFQDREHLLDAGTHVEHCRKRLGSFRIEV